MELKITKEKVLEAASKCSTAKETLKTLFPEAFEERSIEDLANRYTRGILFGTKKTLGMVCPSDTFDDAFLLDGCLDWKIEFRKGCSYLIPTKKLNP